LNDYKAFPEACPAIAGRTPPQFADYPTSNKPYKTYKKYRNNNDHLNVMYALCGSIAFI